jgi:prevent-host-death family protein
VLHGFQRKRGKRRSGSGFGRIAAAGTDGEDAVTPEVFESVWDALEDTPTEAENMKLRSSLMIAISETVSAWGVTQMDAASRLGVTQPRLNDLLRGRVGKFSLDAPRGTRRSRRPFGAFGNHISRIARQHHDCASELCDLSG